MIDRDEALQIARARATENGWAFGEPVGVTLRRRWHGAANRYEIETSVGFRGTKARFVIDATTGKILSEGYIAG
jgi:hypothetical protein